VSKESAIIRVLLMLGMLEEDGLSRGGGMLNIGGVGIASKGRFSTGI
jgi:hypothetical protein